MITRREFCRNLGLLAAGAAALPEQIEAFSHVYDVNLPKDVPLSDVIMITDIMVGGTATASSPTSFTIKDKEEVLLNFGMNLFGGAFRWCAFPGQEILVSKKNLVWKAQGHSIFGTYSGTIIYYDSNMLIHRFSFTGTTEQQHSLDA